LGEPLPSFCQAIYRHQPCRAGGSLTSNACLWCDGAHGRAKGFGGPTATGGATLEARRPGPSRVPGEHAGPRGGGSGRRATESWGLVVELGEHVFDQLGHYLAGTDEDRLADLNDAFRDPGVRAVLTTRGGKGSYRVANAIDFDAVAADPKPLVVSVTSLLAPGALSQLPPGDPSRAAYRLEREVHGAVPWRQLAPGDDDRRTGHPAPTARRGKCPAHHGRSSHWRLLGGNLRGVGQSIGWGPSYDGAVLALEAIDLMPGEIDGTLTQLLNSGVLEGVHGVAVGQFVRSAAPAPGKWSFLDILSDRLGTLGVPVLGGLPFGMGRPRPRSH